MTAGEGAFHESLTPEERVFDTWINRLFLADTDDLAVGGDRDEDQALSWYKIGASTVLACLAEVVPDGEFSALMRRLLETRVPR